MSALLAFLKKFILITGLIFIPLIGQAAPRNSWRELELVENVINDVNNEDNELLKKVASNVFSIGTGSGTLGEVVNNNFITIYSAAHIFPGDYKGVLGNMTGKPNIGVISRNEKIELLLGEVFFRKESKNISNPDVQLYPSSDFLLAIVEKGFASAPVVEDSETPLNPGDPVFILGYPKGKNVLYYSVGPLANFEQINLINSTSPISIDSKVEMVVMVGAYAGMSGGAAYDQFGNLIGIIVRTGTSANGSRYTRIVRKDFIDEELVKSLNLLPPQERENNLKLLPLRFTKKACAQLYK